MTCKLTSHFAGNKVTLFDFQLAEQMNKDFKITSKQHKMYPRMSAYQRYSILIFLGGFTLIGISISFMQAFFGMYPT